MNQFFDQLKDFYSKLGAGQRASIPIVFLLSFAFFIGFLVWAQQEAYTSIFSSNDPGRIKAAATALEEAGLPYVISDDGGQILTTSVNVGQARIISASTNSVTGMEILGEIELGSSPQHERWIYLKAMQGELTKTINSLEEVAASRVHIVEPDNSPFLNRESQGSASVVVRIHPGQSLSSLQVKGITSLVASAVKGLATNQVVLVDESGNLLSGPSGGGNDSFAASSSLLELKQKHESRYKGVILDHVGKILGSTQNVSVAVLSLIHI